VKHGVDLSDRFSEWMWSLSAGLLCKIITVNRQQLFVISSEKISHLMRVSLHGMLLCHNPMPT